MTYCYRCNRLDCNEEYTGESARTFQKGSRITLPIYDHQSRPGHIASVEDFNIVGIKWNNFALTIKESIHIRVNNSTFIRNSGKYKLPLIWNRILFTTLELRIKNQQEQKEPQVHNTTLVASTQRITVENIS